MEESLEEILEEDAAPEITDEVEIEDVATDETEETEESEETEQPEELFVEVEINGKVYSVPEELKDNYLMHSDYTRKTQEVAQTRKQIEEQKANVQIAAQAVQQNLQQYAVLSSLDEQIQQYDQVDWNQLNADDPDAARQHQFHYMQLRDKRNQTYTEIQQREQQQLQHQHQQRAMAMEQSRAVLAKEIEGWSPEVEKGLKEFAVASGAHPVIAENIIADPTATKLLHKAYLYDQMMTKAKHAKPKKTVKPVRSVKGKAPSEPDESKMSMEDWVAMRNKQVASR